MQTREAVEIALAKRHAAQRVANAFNGAVASHPECQGVQLRFLLPNVVTLLSRPDPKGRIPWALVEPELEDLEATGVMDYFCIFNDSHGGVVTLENMQMEDSQDTSWHTEFQLCNDLAQALSCYSYRFSDQQSLLINLQGVRGALTNPDFHFADPEQDPFYSPHNSGADGIAAFFRSHEHNRFCRHALPSLPSFETEWFSNDEYISING